MWWSKKNTDISIISFAKEWFEKELVESESMNVSIGMLSQFLWYFYRIFWVFFLSFLTLGILWNFILWIFAIRIWRYSISFFFLTISLLAVRKTQGNLIRKITQKAHDVNCTLYLPKKKSNTTERLSIKWIQIEAEPRQMY